MSKPQQQKPKTPPAAGGPKGGERPRGPSKAVPTVARGVGLPIGVAQDAAPPVGVPGAAPPMGKPRPF